MPVLLQQYCHTHTVVVQSHCIVFHASVSMPQIDVVRRKTPCALFSSSDEAIYLVDLQVKATPGSGSRSLSYSHLKIVRFAFLGSAFSCYADLFVFDKVAPV